MLRIAVDTGGTFTDFIISDGNAFHFFKLPSSLSDPAIALVSGIMSCNKNDEDVELLHGSTVATNALLENKFSKTAFVTTIGFEDILHLGRQTRAQLYDLEPSKRDCPISREDCYGIDYLGMPLQLPNLSQYEAVAVCLINSYHSQYEENLVADKILQLVSPLTFVSKSCEVSPEYREYERAMATVVNACIGPVMRHYLQSIFDKTVISKLNVMSSAGGHIDYEEAVRKPILTITSGPAAGVAAGVQLAKECANGKAITLDIGGTSADVCLIDNEPLMTDLSEIAGLTARVHRIDVSAIGCGGGSVAYIDAVGALRVGPQSAGADPGPALYGNGGPCTLTDANIVANRLVVDGFGQKITTDIEHSRQAIFNISKKLDLDLESTAELIIDLANAQMSRAIRKVSSLRGYVPSDFTLIAYGGAGGLHACSVANEISIRRILIPATPGIFSAYGLFCAPYIKEQFKTVLSYSRPAIWHDVFSDLMLSMNSNYSDYDKKCYAGFRYMGQSYEIEVDALGSYDDAVDRFHKEHMRIYSYEKPDREVQWVSARVRLEKMQDEVLFNPFEQLFVQLQSRSVESLWKGDRIVTPVCLRTGISESGEGPLIIVQPDSSTYVAPSWSWKVLGNGVLELIKQK